MNDPEDQMDTTNAKPIPTDSLLTLWELVATALLFTLPSIFLVFAGPEKHWRLDGQDSAVLTVAYILSAVVAWSMGGLTRLRRFVNFALLLVVSALGTGGILFFLEKTNITQGHQAALPAWAMIGQYLYLLLALVPLSLLLEWKARNDKSSSPPDTSAPEKPVSEMRA